MRHVRVRVPVLAGLLVCCLSASAGARNLFVARIEIGGSLAGFDGTDEAPEVPDLVDTFNLLELDPGYTGTESVDALLDLRGLPTRLSYAAGDTALVFEIPAIGVQLRFDGATRDEAQEALEDWLKGDFDSALAPDELLTDFLQALVKYSPVDPVAGNPNSLQSRMFTADWRVGTSGPLVGDAGGERVPNLFGIAPAGGYYQGGPQDFDVFSIDLPLQLALNWERVSLVFDMPLTATATEGSWSGLGSFGVGVKLRPLRCWEITPVARFGGVGSIDVGGVALMFAGTVTSHVRIPIGPVALGIANMAGAATTFDDLEIAGYELAYDLTNGVTRNGGYIEGTFGGGFEGRPLGWRIFGNDTRFFGDDLFVEASEEVGVTLSWMNVVGGAPYDVVSFTFAYVFGDDYEGGSLQLAFRF